MPKKDEETAAIIILTGTAGPDWLVYSDARRQGELSVPHGIWYIPTKGANSNDIENWIEYWKRGSQSILIFPISMHIICIYTHINGDFF